MTASEDSDDMDTGLASFTVVIGAQELSSEHIHVEVS